jgi:hypothetical protein
MAQINQQWQLTAYADGRPGPEHFTWVETAVPQPGDGQLVVQAHYFGLDPFPRLRMSAAGAVPPLPLGSVMIGRGVGQVVASRHPGFAVGDFVAGELGWQTFALLDGVGLQKVDPALGPISTSLGVLGPPGLAAYFATRQARPQPGETVVITGAAGAVGSLAGQIARLWGCRAVGITDGPVKGSFLRDELGWEGVVDYTAAPDLPNAIHAATNGVDVFLDLIGGELHDAVMANLNGRARVVLVGTLANYNEGGRDVGPRNLLPIILKRAHVSGFLVHDYAAEFPQALAQLAEWLHTGQLIYKETIIEGFENLPAAFAQVFQGEQVGKFLVKV